MSVVPKGGVFHQARMAVALQVALHPAIAPSAPEAKYALRTLLRLAGYGCEFVWARDSAGADFYYGPEAGHRDAKVCVTACGRDFAKAGDSEPCAIREQRGLWFLDFGGERHGVDQDVPGAARFASDIVFASYWLLSGARESRYRRDGRDNFHLNGAFLASAGALAKPLVSLYAAFLRRTFAALGKTPLPLPWTTGDRQAAIALSHDVDYPEMIRWIEFLRVFAGRTAAPRRMAREVLSGSNHFWRFTDWVDFARRYNARPAFYFSARRGSLWQYATGTPDCFYDIHTARFRRLFAELRDQGCEIGLHASYHACKDPQQLRQEKESLERAAGEPIAGGRHHYWRLNPEAPHETLAHHAKMGMQYDSSLAFEFYPGFRRGVCHPFRPYHPGERRELEIVELPPTWMDDHFDRRLAMNRIADPHAPEAEVREHTSAYARNLLDTVRSTSGVAVLDYHVRGMNADFFPRYGPWLARFAEKHFDSSLHFATPMELTRLYRSYEDRLEAVSRDHAEDPGPLP